MLRERRAQRARLERREQQAGWELRERLGRQAFRGHRERQASRVLPELRAPPEAQRRIADRLCLLRRILHRIAGRFCPSRLLLV